MSGFMKEVLNSVIKKFEIFDTFYKYDKEDIDFKTRIDSYEIDDMSYLHTLHDYWSKNWIIGYDEQNKPIHYESPLLKYLERKKRLRVSRDGLGRKEMESILKETIEENKDKKSSWNKMLGQ